MSVGLGFSPFGLSVFGYPSDDPAESVPAKIGSARKVNTKTRRYVVADDGGFEAMDETAQRVVLLLAFGVKLPDFVTPQGEADMEQAIRAALAPMLDTRDPDIELDEASVGHTAPATEGIVVRFKNLRTGTYQYVKAL
jgi:hypothetical protein